MSILQAHPRVYIDQPDLLAAVNGVDLAEATITSDLVLAEGPAPGNAFGLDEVPGVAVVVEPAAGSKCQRCWRLLPEVGTLSGAPDLCGRCADAVQVLGVPAE